MKIFVLNPDISFPPQINENERKIISVFLRGNKPTIHNFRCSECGRIVFQYSGDIDTIYDGAKIPEERAILDVLCHQCKVVYRTEML